MSKNSGELRKHSGIIVADVAEGKRMLGFVRSKKWIDVGSLDPTAA